MVTSTWPALHARLTHWIKAEWLLVLFGALALVLALADPQPAARYRHWLQLPTLAGKGTRYYWRVRACNGTLCSTWSSFWSFSG